ncbi:hypothetical protein D9619_002101 [Psilocybe cf. subviscida]|uniref:N-acetyltransferase domain-containing protein n=1 Tax=Psilocybe cf. subviscida TaxID=2480587 RepID=A0A8H5F396_9AGAR|nr:hypothetical protein D9619_002101 [Psilocybe cf. subviscida]
MFPQVPQAQATFPVTTATQASQLSPDVWATLEGDQVNANVILPTLYKCLSREQSGRPTQGHLWVVVYSPAPRSRVLYVASCTDGYQGKYPVFLYTTTPPPSLRHDHITVTAPLRSIAQALWTVVGSRRVYSVFGPTVLAEVFCRIWTGMTHIGRIAQPYYDSKISFVNLRTFRDASDQRISQGRIAVRPATSQDIPQIAQLCGQFAGESPPFVLTQIQALQEANYLFAHKLVWVLTVTRNNLPEVATIVAFTRNSRNAATITKVFTPVQHRGNRYAETLVREVVRYLLNQGGKQNVALYVGVTNMAANVYRRVGFVGLEPNAPPVDGVDRWVEYGFNRDHVDLGHW